MNRQRQQETERLLRIAKAIEFLDAWPETPDDETKKAVLASVAFDPVFQKFIEDNRMDRLEQCKGLMVLTEIVLGRDKPRFDAFKAACSLVAGHEVDVQLAAQGMADPYFHAAVESLPPNKRPKLRGLSAGNVTPLFRK